MSELNIEETIKRFEELSDGLSDKINNAHVWTAINDMQFALHDLRKAHNKMILALYQLKKAVQECDSMRQA